MSTKGATNDPDLRRMALEVIRQHVASKTAPHGNKALPGLQIRLHSHNGPLLDAFTSFVLETRTSIGGFGMGATPLRMEVQKWSVLSSPHVHKTAWTQLERRSHGRVVQMKGLSGELARRIIWYLQQHAPPDVQMECEMHEYLPVATISTRQAP